MATLFISSLNAYGGDFYVSVDGGESTLDMKKEYVVDAGYADIDGLSASVGGGYVTDTNVVIGVNLSGTTSDTLLGATDDYELYESKLTLGYQFNIAKHFRIVPSVGVSRWKMTTREGVIFNSGPEDKLYYKGSDSFGQINIDFPINRLVVVSGTFTKGRYDFGTAEAMRVGVKFQF